MHGSWDASGDHFLVCSENTPATVLWYSITRSDNTTEEFVVRPISKCTSKRIDTAFSTAEFSEMGHVVAVAEDHSRLRTKPPPKKKEV